MKKLLFLLTLLSPLLASAQTTNVTATVTDPNGVTYSNGTWTAAFVNRIGFTGVPLLNGSPFTMSYNGTLDNNGAFTIGLADLSQVSPLQSSWRFIICSASSGTCFESVRTEVIGGGVNLSTQLSLAAPVISGVSFASVRFGPGETPVQIWGASGQSAPLTFMKDAKGKLLWQFSTLGITFPDGTFQSTAGGGGAGSVLNVFGRTGSILAASGDYNFNQLAGSLGASQTPLTTAGDFLFLNTNLLLVRFPVGANGQYLGVAGGLPAYLNFPTLSQIAGNLLLAQLPLTLRGDLLTVNSTPALARLALGTNGQCLTSNGLDAIWGSCLAGGASLSADNVWALPQRFKGPGFFDVTAYSASGSSLNTTAATTASSTSITLAAALDFKNGQGVFIDKAGPNGSPFCSTIVSGAGTVALVLAAAPSVTGGAMTLYHEDGFAIQAANDAAETFNPNGLAGGGGIVFFPSGTYYNTCTPLHKHPSLGSGNKSYRTVRWVGVSRESVTVGDAVKVGNGPGLVIVDRPPLYVGAPTTYLGTSLLTGSGNSFIASGLFLDLRQCEPNGSTVPHGCGEVDGLTSMTVEATIKPTAVSADAGIVVSSGSRDSIDGFKSAFAVAQMSTGALRCSITTSNGTATITGASGAIVAGVQSHEASSYDGSSLRCFHNGTQVTGSPVAITGTVKQAPFEEARVASSGGPFLYDDPGSYGQFNGLIDGVRISGAGSGSSGARYTANFTAPTTKWSTADSNTMVQLNFDNNPDVFTVGTSGVTGNSVPVYIMFRGTSPAQCSSPAGEIAIENMRFSYDDGVMSIGQTPFGFKHLEFVTGHNGFWQGASCSYFYTFDDITVTASGRYGAALSGGIGRADHIQAGGNAGSAATVLLFLGGNSTYSNLFITPASPNVVSVIFKSPAQATSLSGAWNYTIANNINVDVEFSNSSLQSLIMLDNLGTAYLNGGVYECSVANDNCYPLTIQNTVLSKIVNVNMAPGKNVVPIHFVPNTAPAFQKAYTAAQGITIEVSSYIKGNGAPIGWTDAHSSVPVTITNSAVSVGGDRTASLDSGYGIALGAAPLSQGFSNDTSTGTVYSGTIAKLTGNPSVAVIAASTDTRGILGCVMAQAGKSGEVRIATNGRAGCIYDNATTAGDYVIPSTILNGALHDIGTTPSATVQNVGQVMKTTALIAAPTSVSLTCPATGGTVAAGTYFAKVTYVNAAEGETTALESSQVTCSGSTSSLVVSGVNPYTAPGLLGYRVYLTGTNGASNTETLQTITSANCNDINFIQLKDYGICAQPVDINGNAVTTSTFTLTATPTTGGASPPGSNTAGQLVATLLTPGLSSGGGGSGVPGGANTQMQWNSLGAFAGSPNITYTASTGVFNFAQLANGNSSRKTKRFTDTSPTGFLDEWRNAADTVTLASLDVLGNHLAASYVANGAGAGYLGLSQGASQTTAACPSGGVNCILHQAPTAVTPYMITWPGVAASGLLRGTTSGSGATLTDVIDYVTPTSKAYFDAAGCSAGTGSPAWDTAQTAVCNIGTNVYEGVVQFTATSQTAQFKLPLPADWTGAIDARLSFYDSATSGTVTPTIATACTSGGAGITDDTAFNTANSFGSITLTSPANALWTATVTGITTTGCSAGNWMQVRIGFSAIAGTVNARGVELTLRRTF